MNWLQSVWYRGRHHWGDSDLMPEGQVWFHDGVWWTFDIWHPWRVPRDFAGRPNPLDERLRHHYRVRR